MDLLNKKSTIPLYEQLKVELLRLIVSDYFKTKNKFYSLSEIVKKYHVSQITARRVINELAADGYLKTAKGKKPLVTASKTNNSSLPLLRIAVFFYSKSDTATIKYDEMAWTSTIFSGIQKKLLEKGALWTMVPAVSPDDALKKLEQIQFEHDAFICFSTVIGEMLLDNLEKTQRPFVIIQPKNENLSDNFVSADYYTGSVKIAEKAIFKKYKSFLYLASDFNENPEKMRGFQEALLKQNIPPQNIYIRTVGSIDKKNSEARFEDFIKEEGRDKLLPLAVYSFGDNLSIGVLSACLELGLKIPEEVGVAGSTGLIEAEQSVPPLTTMQIPMCEMGYTAVNMIFEMLANDKKHMPGVKLEVKLIERKSL